MSQVYTKNKTGLRKENNMKVLKLLASKPLEEKVLIKEIDGELESLQNEVEGYIDFFEVNISGKFFNIILNDEGKLQQLKPNIAILHEGELVDLIVGDVLLVTVNDEGETIGLTEEEIFILSNYFSVNGVASSIGVLSFCEI